MSQWARTTSGDMLLPLNGQGADAIVTDPGLCTQIKIPSVLKMVLGEWFLDTTLGFPWPSIWSQKAPNLVALRQLFRKTILSVPLVVSLVDLVVNYDRALRNFTYEWQAVIATGQVVQSP